MVKLLVYSWGAVILDLSGPGNWLCTSGCKKHQGQLGREDIVDITESDWRPDGGLSALQVDVAIGLAQCHAYLAKLAFEKKLPVTGMAMLEGAPRHVRAGILIEGPLCEVIPWACAMYRRKQEGKSEIFLANKSHIDAEFSKASEWIKGIENDEIRETAIQAAAGLLAHLDKDRALKWSGEFQVAKQ